MKILDNPEIDNNQVKTSSSLPLAAIKLNNPNTLVIRIATNGRPARSTYPHILGARFCSASDTRVLEVAYTDEDPRISLKLK